MTANRQNVLIGLFVLIGLVCLGVMIIMFGESRGLFGKRYIVTARFDRVPRVREGTEVDLAGVWAGSVLDVKLADPKKPNEGVNVLLEIDRELSVPGGSKAVVVTALMGQPVINIVPPAETLKMLPQDGTAIIHGEVRNPLDTVIDPKMMATLEKTTAQIGTLAEALTPAAKAIQDILEQRTIKEVEASQQTPQEITANLYTAAERLHDVLKHFDDVLGDPEVQSNLKQTLANFKDASNEAKEAVAELKQFGQDARQVADSARVVIDKAGVTVDTTQRHVDQLGRKLLVNVDQLSRFLDYLNKAGRDVTEGKGTVAMLLQDPKFYEEMLLTTQRLGDAARELQVLIKQWQTSGIMSSAR